MRAAVRFWSSSSSSIVAEEEALRSGCQICMYWLSKGSVVVWIEPPGTLLRSNKVKVKYVDPRTRPTEEAVTVFVVYLEVILLLFFFFTRNCVLQFLTYDAIAIRYRRMVRKKIFNVLWRRLDGSSVSRRGLNFLCLSLTYNTSMDSMDWNFFWQEGLLLLLLLLCIASSYCTVL